MPAKTIGWDIGGAHIKAALIDEQGSVQQVLQQPCQLWQGIQELHRVMQSMLEQLVADDALHAVTMTGELVDLFASRSDGVLQIVAAVQSRLAGQEIHVYAGNSGFLEASCVDTGKARMIASANWLASASWAAESLPAGVFFDIGSTTTDILLFDNGRVNAVGMTDYQRLCSGELVYTGIVRTPVMAIDEKGIFQGHQVGLMAEYFATMADVYRLTGELHEAHDQTPAADGGEKTVAGSARRLSRMVGCDFDPDQLPDWMAFAQDLRARQLDRIERACNRQLARAGNVEAVFVGAGVGRFLVRELAEKNNLCYIDFSSLLAHQRQNEGLQIADCAPAVAIAALLQGSSG